MFRSCILCLPSCYSTGSHVEFPIHLKKNRNRNRKLCWQMSIINTELALIRPRMLTIYWLLFSQQCNICLDTREHSSLQLESVDFPLKTFSQLFCGNTAPPLFLWYLPVVFFLFIHHESPIMLSLCLLQYLIFCYAWVEVFHFDNSADEMRCYAFYST